MTVKVLIADNHPIFRSGLRQVVEDMPDHLVVGEAADGDSCISQARILRPDIVTIDLNMPGKSGFEVVSWIVSNIAGCLAIVVTMHADRAFVEEAAEAGAHGFIAKEDTGVELATAFESARLGFYMSSSAGRSEPVFLERGASSGELVSELKSLTHAEARVLQMVAASRTSRDIAAELGIAERTVHSHRNNICAKLGIKGANGLLHFAVRHRDIIVAADPK